MASKDDKKPKVTDLTPEQIRGLLSSDFQTSKRPKSSPRSSARRLFWAGLILTSGVLYAIFRFALAPAKVILITASGEDAVAVSLTTGTQHLDLGPLSNGESKTVQLMPGHPLRVEVRFDTLQTWTNAQPLAPFQSVTLIISVGRRIQTFRQTPWSRSNR